MRASLLTIPINDVLEPRCGCPLCRMRDLLEERFVGYIMGDAMMEPDIRIETNKKGFCPRHFKQMQQAKNRLSLALMLQTHLDKLKQDFFDKSVPFGKKDGRTPKLREVIDSCFVCDMVSKGMKRLIQTFCEMAADDTGLIREQEFICLPHFQQVTAAAPDYLSKKQLESFSNLMLLLVKNYIDVLYGDVSHFCSMYDYRNSGKDADWGNSKDSIERSIAFLTENFY
ncbi:MAG: DUF6062 family protein [Ruminococcus sp.]|jgi:hypothetical protein|nr:DUF6062 family protein [Ruminococcus sp.]